MEETWDSVKALIPRAERMKDIYSIERDYLDSHPESGYFTDIMHLEEFPDYIDYLPKGAIARKVKVMEYMPQKEASQYPYIGMTREEYHCFVSNAAKLVEEAIHRFKRGKL